MKPKRASRKGRGIRSQPVTSSLSHYSEIIDDKVWADIQGEITLSDALREEAERILGKYAEEIIHELGSVTIGEVTERFKELETALKGAARVMCELASDNSAARAVREGFKDALHAHWARDRRLEESFMRNIEELLAHEIISFLRDSGRMLKLTELVINAC